MTELVMERVSVSWLAKAFDVAGAERLRRLAVMLDQMPDKHQWHELFGEPRLPALAHLRLALVDDDVSALGKAKLPALRHLAIGAVKLGLRAAREVGARQAARGARARTHADRAGGARSRDRDAGPAEVLVLVRPLRPRASRGRFGDGFVDLAASRLAPRFARINVIEEEREPGWDWLTLTYRAVGRCRMGARVAFV